MAVFMLVSAMLVFSGIHDTRDDSWAGSGERSSQEAFKEKTQTLIFGVFAEGEEQLRHTLILVESIRTFTGSYKNSPVC